MKFTRKFVFFGDSWELWGAPNTGKCKMTHYYWSKTTLGHLFWHPKSTPKELKIHPKSPKNGEISKKIGWKSPKILVNFTRNLVMFGDSGMRWGAPNAGKCRMTYYYWAKTTLGHLFRHPKSTPNRLVVKPTINSVGTQFHPVGLEITTIFRELW